MERGAEGGVSQGVRGDRSTRVPGVVSRDVSAVQVGDGVCTVPRDHGGEVVDTIGSHVFVV